MICRTLLTIRVGPLLAAALGFCHLLALPLHAQEESPATSLLLTSNNFSNGGDIPKQFSCDGANRSPNLSWTGAPAGTKSFALLVDDPDAPAGNWNHWAIWNIPSSVHSLPEGVRNDPRLPDGSEQGMNDFHKIGYNGPCPPAPKPHRYHFKLFALDTKMSLNSEAGKPELEKAMKGHILAKSEWIGLYKK